MKKLFLRSEEEKPIIRSKDLMISLSIFLGMITLLIMHKQLEELFNLKRNSMLLGSVMGIAGIVLLIDWKRARVLLETRVDWWTLSFFMMLFASVGALESAGITEVVAKSLLSVAGDNEHMILIIFTWTIGLLSAFLDNVVAVATFIPIVHELSNFGVQVYPFWWAMLFSATYFGNLTVIGSTANIVAVGMLERQEGLTISFMDWLKAGIIVSVLTLILANLWIYSQIPLMKS